MDFEKYIEEVCRVFKRGKVNLNYYSGNYWLSQYNTSYTVLDKDLVYNKTYVRTVLLSLLRKGFKLKVVDWYCVIVRVGDE